MKETGVYSLLGKGEERGSFLNWDLKSYTLRGENGMTEKPIGDGKTPDYQNIVEEINQLLIKKTEDKPEDTSEDTTRSEDSSRATQLPSSASSPTGIEELDRLLGGGFPKGAVILLAGSSGSGKTILSFQWIFEGVKYGEKGVYVTLTEPVFKLLENLEKMSYYDREAVERGDVTLIDLREKFPNQGVNPRAIIDFIVGEVKRLGARRLCVDSITAIAYQYNERYSIRSFIFELGKVLAVLGCTSVLISEVHDADRYSVYDVEEFISDGIIRLDQVRYGDRLSRVLRVVKMRGRSFPSEDIPMRISRDGIRLFPKMKPSLTYASTSDKISTGNPVLDEMIEGGLIRGSTTLVAGPTGTGKTVLSLQFLMEGLRNGESCFYIGFEESRDQLFRNAMGFGWDLEDFEGKGLLTVYCVYPGEKLLEEHLRDILQVVREKKVKRCVIDSLSALSHAFSEDIFSEFAPRLNGYLKNFGVTSIFTAATGAVIGSTTLAESKLSSVTDNIIMLRYVEMQGKLESVINVLKMRGSRHDKDLRRYEITSEEGLVIGESLTNYEGVMTGVSRRIKELEEESERLKKIIQEKEEMEKKLRESEERYRTIFENSPAAIMLTDPQERLISWNVYTETLLGMTYDELYLRPISSFYPAEEWQRIRAEKVREKGVKHNIETKMIRKDGVIIDVNLSLSVLRNQEGDVTGAIGIVEDITEKKQMEREIRLKEKALESSVNAIVFVDSNSRITYVNPSFLDMWGYDGQEEVLGKPVIELWQRKGEFMDIFDIVMEEGRWIGEFTAQKKDGKVFSVQLSASIVKDENDDFSHLMLSFIDISEKKEAEEELKENLQTIKTILEHIPYGLVIVGRDKIIRNANKAALKILGREREEVVNHICHKNICPAEEGRCPVLDLGQTIDKSEKIALGRDGREIPILKTVIPVNIGGEDVLLEAFIDLTERKKMEEFIKRQNEELKESKQDLQRYIDNLLTFNARLNPDGIIEMINQTAIESIDVNPERVIGRHFADTPWWSYDIDLQNRIREYINRAKNGEVIVAEEKIKVKDGFIIIQFSLRPVFDEDGKVKYFVAEGQNITGLREMEEKFRAIGESARDAIIMLDNNSNICYWNKAAEEMFGYKKEEVIGKNLYGLLTPKSLGEMHVEAFNRFRETGELTLAGKALEVPAKKKDGTEFIMEMSLSSVKLRDKWHAIGIIRDVTERRQMEERLKQAYREAEELLNAAADGIRIINRDFTVRALNSTMARLAGVEKDKAVGMKCSEMFGSDVCGTKDCSMARVLKEGKPIYTETVRRRVDGKLVPCLHVATPLRDADGDIIGIIEDFRDITEQKEMEEKLREKIDELERYKKLTVGRELRMIELKQRIKELEEEIRKLQEEKKT